MDSDVYFRRSVTVVLRRLGFLVVEATPGVGALALLAPRQVSLVVSAELEFVRKLRGAGGDVPVILVADERAVDPALAEELGVQRWLARPLYTDALEEAVRASLAARDWTYN